MKLARWKNDDGIFLRGNILTLNGVQYCRHVNGGGWVAKTAKVDKTAFVGFFARVDGDARVSGNTHVFGDAKVYDDDVD